MLSNICQGKGRLVVEFFFDFKYIILYCRRLHFYDRVNFCYLTILNVMLSGYRLFNICIDYSVYEEFETFSFFTFVLSFSLALFLLLSVISLFEEFRTDFQVDGMVKQCSGSVDRTLPKEIMRKTFPCDIFFGRDSSHSWGLGGVAFLNPEKKFEGKTYMCLYKIS